MHWTALPAPPAPLGYHTRSANGVTDVAFADHANGFLYGPGLLATHNAGQSWTRQPLPPVQALGVGAGYAYALTRHGSVAGLWRAAVGGSRWAQLPVPPGAGRPVSSGYGTQLYVEGGTLVLLRSGFTGPAVTPGQVGQLWVSSDRGTGWQARPVPCTSPEGGGAAVLGIALGHPDAWLLDCFNNEQSSQEQTPSTTCTAPPTPGCPGSASPTPPGTTCPACSPATAPGTPSSLPKAPFDTLVGTLDGGRHWHTVLRDGGTFFGWAGLRFVNTDTGFVVGPTHYTPEHLYRTGNGGRTWRALHL